MTDDADAVLGIDAGYVPCPDLAAAEPGTGDDGEAVIGAEEGYVAVGDSAAAEPSTGDSGYAVAGFDEGYVASPCFECGLTDAFQGRTVSGDWGTSDAGIAWEQFDGTSPGPTPGVTYSVDGAGAISVVTDASTVYGSIALPMPTMATMTVTCVISDYSTDDFLLYLTLTSPADGSSHYVYLDPFGSQLGVVDATDSSVPFTYDGRPLNLRIEWTPTGTGAALWYVGDAYPGITVSSVASAHAAATPMAVAFEADGSFMTGTTYRLQALNVLDANGVAITRCYVTAPDANAAYVGDRTTTSMGQSDHVSSTGQPQGSGPDAWWPALDDVGNHDAVPGSDDEFRVFVSHLIPAGVTGARFQAWVTGTSTPGDWSSAPVPFPTTGTAWTLARGTWAVGDTPTFDDVGSTLTAGVIHLPGKIGTDLAAIGAANPVDVTFPVSGTELHLVFEIDPMQSLVNAGTPAPAPTAFAIQPRFPGIPDDWAAKDRIRFMQPFGDPLSDTEFYTITWLA